MTPHCLAQVNLRAAKKPKEPMPTDVMAWFGSIGVALADAWNCRQHTITDADLLTAAMGKGSKPIAADKWSKAVSSLCDADQPMHFLLLTNVPGEFIVNQPGLDAF